MFEYRFCTIKVRDSITDTMNYFARDGWRVVAISSNNAFGATISYDIVVERDKNYEYDSVQYEYECFRISKNITDFMDEKSRAGWRVVGYTSCMGFGASIDYVIAFERPKR